ncbi:MAG: DNA adenine methylase [Patescibacteria group bacterium]
MKNDHLILQLVQTYDINTIYARRVVQLASQNSFITSAEEIISNRPKPFVKWVGGKRQLLRQFRERKLYPPEKFDPSKNSYFEPFVGGGAVFFDLLPERAYLSDLNKELIITYKVIKNCVELLINLLKRHVNDKEYFLDKRSQSPDNLSDLDVASRFIYLNRTCFNGMYRVNKSGEFNVPFGKYTNPLICDEINLRRVSHSLQNVELVNSDYREILNKASKGDFVYFDPPYYPINKTSQFTSYTSQDFLEKEQIELKDTFVNLNKRGCYLMLSDSDTKFIKDLYSNIKGVNINEVFAGRAINSDATKRGKIKEVLITNY